MKSRRVLSFLMFTIFIEFLSCNQKSGKNDASELALLTGRYVRLAASGLLGGVGGLGSSGGSGNSNKVVLNGSVKGPGSITNAKVNVFATPANGQCVKDDGSLNGTPISMAVSDSNGKYSITFDKTGTTVCVVVVPADGTQIEVFSPVTKTNTPKPWSGGNSLMAIINEPTGSATSRTANVTPYTRLAARRFSALSAINPSSRSRVFLGIRKAFGRAAADNNRVEFANNTATTLLDKANEDVENAFFPKRDKTSFSLDQTDPSNPSYALKLGSVLITADKLGGGVANGSTTSTDLEKVINFMEEDFSDGRFDGKKVDDATGKIATMSTTDFGGVVASKQAADDFLKKDFKAAQTEYDSVNSDVAATADDELFCESDSLEAACNLTIVPGSPPEMWLFNDNEDFVDIGDSYDHGGVGFGTGGTSSTRYFAIINGGGSDLKLTLPFTFSGSQFTVVEQPDAVVASGDATYFAVKFVPSSATTFSKTMTMASNDTAYSPYTVTLDGTGVDLSTNLQLFWAFTGNTTDSSGNSRNGTKVGRSVPLSLTYDLWGVTDKAFNFDGGSDEVTNTFSFALGSAASFSAWVSPADLSNPSYSILKRGAVPEFQLMFLDDVTLRFTVNTSSGGVLDLDLVIDPVDFIDEWNLVTAVYDGANMRLYLNGEEWDFQPKTGTLTSSTGFSVGNDASGNYFDGDIDDVRVYNRALTAAQVYALYNQD
ncbi:MAG: LamG domain-containing protein [Leptospiraceae bacterium]|nr:LamG domain-containing protein [Leptospiraceae bacterium]